MDQKVSAAVAPTVVLVEDDPAVRAALELTLDLEGYHVEMCESAEALLFRTLPEAGACLVVDEHLPGLSGLAALIQLRKRKVSLPAILMTTNPKAALRAAAALAGVPIVEKPLLDDALIGAIRAALAG